MFFFALLAIIAAGSDDLAIERAFQQNGAKGVLEAAKDIEQACGASDAVKAMTRLLNHDDIKIRAASAYALGHMSDAGKAALPEIARPLSEFDFRFANYLNEFGAGDIPIWLAEAALRPNDTLNAYRAIQTLKPKDGRLVSMYVRALDHRDLFVRWRAVVLLGEMEEKAGAACPALVQLLKQEPPQQKQPDENRISGEGIREQAAYALGCIDSESQETVSLLTAMLQHKSRGIRKWSALGLGRMGIRAEAAIPALINLLADDECALEPAICAYSAGPEHAGSTALVNIGRDTIPALIQALSSKKPVVRSRAAEALFYFGPEAETATEQLILLLLDQDANVRSKAVYALRSISPDDRRLVPEMVRLLDDSSPEVREAVLWCLEELAPPEILKSTVARLVKDLNENVRESAMEVQARLPANAE